jgi:hypothetical protein
MIGLEVNIEGESRVFLNPSDYIFENYLHHGFVIAGE